MPFQGTKPRVTASALGGYFAVLAMEPNANFYNSLRQNGAESLEICWVWLCAVSFVVDFTVQHETGAQPTLDHPANRVLKGMIENVKAVGVKTDADLQQIEARLQMFGKLIGRRASSMEIGEHVAESMGLKITNSVTLFRIGQKFLELVADVGEKFTFFEVC